MPTRSTPLPLPFGLTGLPSYFHKYVIARTTPFFDLDVDGPTLVRVNRTFNQIGGATIFAPTAGGAFSLCAWPYGETPPGNAAEQNSRAYRGPGPLIFLPRAGRWAVQIAQNLMGGALLPNFTTVELSLMSMPPELAVGFLTAPPPTWHVSGNFDVAAGGSLNIFGPTGLDLSASPPAESPAIWHNVCRLDIHMNTSPMTDFKVSVARPAGAAVGAVLSGFGRRTFEWPQIAGAAVYVFNNTAGVANVCVEAHFL